jgi:cathepsin L
MAKSAAVLLAASLASQSCLWASATVLRVSQRSVRGSLNSYTYTQFAREFGRTDAPGTVEYNRRLALFQAELAKVEVTNARNAREGRLWKAGVHPFMDWTEAERRSMNGYKPSHKKGHKSAVSLLHSSMRAFGHTNATHTRRVDLDEVSSVSGGLTADAGPPIRNQGNCGSCWAISAAEAVEAQLQRSGSDARVSAQAFVDCVPNPQHCGGSGGCDGATGELAYAFARDYGIPLEADLPYTARTEQCPENPLSGAYPAPTRVRVSGWTALPSNKAQPLMQALVQRGPVVIAVDGNNWFNYENGIFDDCPKDATLGHAVLAKGYGQEAGNNFWLIQNSWGREWGEKGHIRLIRHDEEDSWCGTDRSPKDGVGCDGGPSEVTVCGTCGMLYDSIIPDGVRLESGKN